MRREDFHHLIRQPGRLIALGTAILIYGLAGAPTPDALGLPEMAVGALLIAAGGLGTVLSVFRAQPVRWRTAAQMLFFYGLSVPLINALLRGAPPVLIVRDLIPFGFLLLPFFLAGLPPASAAARRGLTGVAVAAGLCFAARVLIPLFRPGAPPERWAVPDPQYFANAPTVLFAALLPLGLAGLTLYARPGWRAWSRAALLVLPALVPLAAMAVVRQRATLAAIALYVVALLLLGLWRRPDRGWRPLLAVLVIAVLLWPQLAEMAHMISVKTHAVGINMRGAEAKAVFARLSGDPVTVLFGRGWGATVASPAVGGQVVNFTHNLLTTYWLKTGLCGVILVVHYLARLGLLLARQFTLRPVLTAALAAPLLIDVTLYASFKSLDFGLMLFFITLWADPAWLRRRAAYSMQDVSSEAGHVGA